MNRTLLKTKHGCEFSAAKKIYYLLLMTMCVYSLPAAARCVNIKQVSADYKNNKVTIAITRTGCMGDTTNHRNTAWVFVDYRATGSGSWTRATISTTSSGTVVNSGNSKGVWIYGANGSQTVTLTLNSMPAKYDWCAYATDYPPNAASYNNGTYTLRGTIPFYINGSTTPFNSKNYSGGIINSITDATGCSGWVERDVATTNGAICKPGLTFANGYCRDLIADVASTFSCSGKIFEAKKEVLLATWLNRNNVCPSTWSTADYSQLKCLYSAGLLNTTHSYPKDETPWDEEVIYPQCVGWQTEFLTVVWETSRIPCAYHWCASNGNNEYNRTSGIKCVR